MFSPRADRHDLRREALPLDEFVGNVVEWAVEVPAWRTVHEALLAARCHPAANALLPVLVPDREPASPAPETRGQLRRCGGHRQRGRRRPGTGQAGKGRGSARGALSARPPAGGARSPDVPRPSRRHRDQPRTLRVGVAQRGKRLPAATRAAGIRGGRGTLAPAAPERARARRIQRGPLCPRPDHPESSRAGARGDRYGSIDVAASGD